MNCVKTMKKFYDVLDALDKNEVYIILLIGIKNNKRKILDTVMIKTNEFEEFATKVSFLQAKAKRLPFKTELLIDVNKKNVVKGFLNAEKEILKKIANDSDVRNLFQIILRNIRYCPTTNYTMLKSNEFLHEVDAKYVVKHDNIYYHIIDYECKQCIKKPEIPIPGTVLNGKMVELYYVRD